MASSSSSEPRPNEVFISFRGEDTRNNFVSHLNAALKQRGIQTYFDEDNLQKGQTISDELMKAIQESSFAIVVLSANYATSTWCLNELVEIMKCKKRKPGLTVIPIFYHVDPSDVRRQKRSFEEAFSIHEEKFEEEPKIWRQALREVADLAGEDMQGKNEAAYIKEIADDILYKLPVKASQFRKSVVGIESRISEIQKFMLTKPDEVLFIGIHGMGGIGKTTTARAIYEDYKTKFEGHCFLENVRGSKNLMKDLQKTLLSEVLKMKDFRDICNEVDGTSIIQGRCRFKKVLLVIDDVDHIDQLNALAEPGWFGRGSRILITTRDVQLLNAVHSEKYDVQTLGENEALQLLCLHAFKEDHPPDEDYKQLSLEVLRYAGCLPLALKVLGRRLYKEEKATWQGILKDLKANPTKEIISQLRISFDALEKSQQNIFLHIACFFKGYTKRSVEERLQSLDLQPMHIQVLIQKSLIQEGSCISMHDLLQEMGWHIVREKAGEDIYRYDRLWFNKDIVSVLTNITEPSKAEWICMPIHAYPGDDLTRRYRLGWEGALRIVKRLKLLELQGDFFNGNYDVNLSQSSGLDICPSLQFFSWTGYPGQSLPKSFHPKYLTHLYMENSNIEETPDFSQMQYLEVLNLSYSMKLVNVHPSLGVHKKIRHISLVCCRGLKEFPIIKGMKSLEILHLSGTYLDHFPIIHGNLDSSKILKLNYVYIDGPSLQLMGETPNLRELELICIGPLKEDELSRLNVAERFRGVVNLTLKGTGIVRMPSFTEFPHLEKLDLSESRRLEEVHASLGCSRKIKFIKFLGCTLLEELPTIISMDSLVELSLESTSLQSFPDIEGNAGNASCLKRIYLGNTKIKTLPRSIGHATSLEMIMIDGDEYFSALPISLIGQSLQQIVILNLPLLRFEGEVDAEAGSPQQLIVPHCTPCTGGLSRMTIDLGNCDMLGELPESVLSRVYSLCIADCPMLSEWIRFNLAHLLEEYQHLHILRIHEASKQLPNYFPEWEQMSNMFRGRQNFFKVYFPGNRIPSWFKYQSCNYSMTVVLPPLDKWFHNRQFRGFVLSGIIEGELLRNTSLSKYNDGDSYTSCSCLENSHVVVMYIPSHDITGNIIHLDGEEECTLFQLVGEDQTSETSTFSRWGLSLVYSDSETSEVGPDIFCCPDDDCGCVTDGFPGDSRGSTHDCPDNSSCPADDFHDYFNLYCSWLTVKITSNRNYKMRQELRDSRKSRMDDYQGNCDNNNQWQSHSQAGTSSMTEELFAQHPHLFPRDPDLTCSQQEEEPSSTSVMVKAHGDLELELKLSL